MTDTQGNQASLAERIDKIEEAYEFMLAYAAQGHESDASGGPSIREFLENADAGLDGLAAAARLAAGGADAADGYGDFIEVLDADSAKARAAIRLVLAQPAIGSQLIDNLNASIHLRALLTDLFLIDETLNKGTGG